MSRLGVDRNVRSIIAGAGLKCSRQAQWEGNTPGKGHNSQPTGIGQQQQKVLTFATAVL